MADIRSIFADGIMEASVAHGVARITLAQTGGDGKPQPAGQLIMPLVQLPAFANGVTQLLKQIEAKAKEAQAAAGVARAAEVLPVEAPAAPIVPGAFRFNGG